MKKIISLVIALVLVLVSSTYIYSAGRADPAEAPKDYTKPKAQFFCGFCHILTYPRVIEKAFKSWKADKHSKKDIGCKVCHYPPETLDYALPEHRGIPKDRRAASREMTEEEFMKTELVVLSRLITIMNMGEAVVRTKPRIDDRSCTASRCHPATGEGKEGEYWTKKIEFAEFERKDKSKAVIPYVHKTHFDSEKFVEGQEMHCTTCHQHETGKKHFEVSIDKCFLCHFKNLELNAGRSKCSLCHEVPTKPLQTQKTEDDPDEKPITHQSLEEKKVPCQSCHLQLKRGNGDVREKNCLDCHDNDEAVMKETKNKKLMHEKHVAAQTANCFNCHDPVEHKETDYLDAVIEQCTACHPGHHKYQKMLIAGTGGKGIEDNFPIRHFNVKVSCFACHLPGPDEVKGVKVMKEDVESCSSCHTEDENKLVVKWSKDVLDMIEEAEEIEQDALKAISEARGRLPEEKIQKAMAMLNEGRENIKIVRAGGGVHNKKYAALLIDVAIERYDLILEDLE